MARSTIPTPEPQFGGDVFVGEFTGKPVTMTRVTIGDRDYALGKSGKVYTLCWKCDGVGRLTYHLNVFAGQCFACMGSGVSKSFPDMAAAQKAARTRAVAAARAERKAAEEATSRDAAFTEWTAANGDLAAALAALPRPYAGDMTDDEYTAWNALEERSSFLADMVRRFRSRNPLTEAQTTAATKALTDDAVKADAEAAAKAAQRYAGAEGDTVTVTGTVAAHVYIEPQNYGWSGSYLVIVEGTGADAGITVKMFGSGKALAGLDRGDTVTVAGPVKSTEEYQGTKQTQIGPRPKITVLEGANA